MNANHKLYERIEALIHKAIQDRLESCRGFKRLEWYDWPGTKALSGVAADAVFMLLDKEGLLDERNSLLSAEPGPIEMLCEERTSPTREDRAYQVLCAILSSPRAPKGEIVGEIANIVWALVNEMEERGARGSDE